MRQDMRIRLFQILLWSSVSLLIYILAETHAYSVMLPKAPPSDPRGGRIAHTFPFLVNFSLLPIDAWSYVISEVWNNFPGPNHQSCDGNMTTWKGVLTWETALRSLRIDANILKFVSATPLTVIIEAKSGSLVSLVPLTVHPSTEKLSGVSLETDDYPHIIQNYQSEKTCYDPVTSPIRSLNMWHLIPAFTRDVMSDVKISANPDFAIRSAGGTDLFLWPKKQVCFSGSIPVYYTLTVGYGVHHPAVQTVDIVFGANGDTLSGNNKSQVLSTRKKTFVKHKHRRHRRARGISFGFPKNTYTAEIMEEQQPPIIVTSLNVSSSKPVFLSMLALMDSRSQAFFSINSRSGVVRTEAVLDRETIAQHYFRITAVSESDRSLTATTTLNIKVLDENDNTPLFEKADYEVSLSENVLLGSVVVTVHASDGDEGGNGQVSYSLENSKVKTDVFQIDAKTGVITTRQPLDREQSEEHVLYVKATDGGRGQDKKSSIAKVVIKILDENDNTPSIASNNSCNLDIREDIDWSTLPTIAQLQAEDKDQGLNGQVRYSIIGGNPNGQFILDAVTGDLKVAAPLDYESERKYRLLVRMQDFGSPPRSNTTLCNINIIDMNDNEPKFSTALYETSIGEDAHVGYPVVQLRAYDSDEGPKGKIIYAIKNQSTSLEMMPFVIDPDSGWITTSTRLDRERKDKYEFTVEASDLGIPTRSSTADVLITILDVNDNGPIFEHRAYNVSIFEGALQGTQIVTIRASDRDLNARLTYQIIKGNEENRFSIINQNGLGLILLTKIINYRRAKQCELIVEVADESGKNDRAKVTVHILAANLHRPTFLNAPFRIQIPENIPTGRTVIELKAVDDDVGENGRIVYTMGNEQGYADVFHLNPQSGVLSVKKVLDREKQAIYTILVTASDNGVPALCDTADVLVELVDVNDNSPTFSQKSYFVAVKEDVSPQSSVTQVSAHDPDFGLNGLVRYSFEGGNSANGTFSIDSALGIIRTVQFLDREVHAGYELLVAAIDRGEPALYSTATVTVKVLDVNDNAPVFSSDVLNFYAPENLTMGSTVAEILASDPDEGQNAVIEYAIVSGPDAESFALITRPNQPPLLSNLIELDHESSRKQYKLVIRASSPPLQTDVTCNVFVTDVNDNAPTLRDFRIVLNSYPRHFPHGVIGRVPATDLDATAKLDYKILSGNKHSLLMINPSNGDIQLSASLNSDVAYSAIFAIQVSDGLNVVSANCTLRTIPVDHKMLKSSLTLRGANLTAKDLLNMENFDRLSEGLAYVSLCSVETVYILSIVDEADAGYPVVNVTFATKKSIESEDFMSPEFLKERLYLQREIFYNMTSVEILPFDDNLCLREPCPNFEKCITAQKFGKVSPFATSDSFFFRSVQPVTTFDCECPAGYTGMTVHYSCDTEVNACYSNPCGANGTCVSTEGGYHCKCQPQFTGGQCEINLRTTECSENFCQGSSTCVVVTGKGVHCADCPKDQHHTPSCELTTRSFSYLKNSYLILAGLKSRNRFSISVRFATTNKNGLLFYNGRYTENADFIAVEIFNGSLQVTFSLGQGTVKNTIPTAVADGQWHNVTLNYLNKTARIALDGCDEALSLLHGTELGYYCAAVATQGLDPFCANPGALCNRFLDLTGPLYLGGIPEGQRETRIKSKHFNGCIQNLEIDSKFVDLSDYFEEHGTEKGCPQKDNQCTASTASCLNGGTCVEEWGNQYCRCPDGFDDTNNCSPERTEIFSLHDRSYLKYQPQFLPPGVVDVYFEFRTSNDSGSLLTVISNNKTLLSVDVSRIYVGIHARGYEREGDIYVGDARWHTLRAKMERGIISLHVDGRTEAEAVFVDYNQADTVSVVFGGIDADARHSSGFTGCLRNIKFGEKSIAPVLRWNIRDGCSNLSSGCDTSPCLGESSECLESHGSYKCGCKKSYVGHHCQDICSFDPCKNGICVHTENTLLGYECKCFGNFTGPYCSEPPPTVCPAAWWGHPVCGPCKCDVTKGFDPRCDKSTGECHCKENFYRPAASQRCRECSCYPRGSTSNECDNSGQCNCRPGVIGTRCDTCSNIFAEVTENGCETVYGACPQSFAEGVWWERTVYGRSTVQNCPRNGIGKAMRTCDPLSRTWSEPNLSNCTSLPFEVCSQLLLELMSGQSIMNTFLAVRAVSELRTALNLTKNEGPLHPKDLAIAYDLLMNVLEYEVSQTGMNLTHRLDKGYFPELMESISQISDIANKEVWKSLDQSRRSLSFVTNLLHIYIKIIAMHFSETHMDPFEIFTKNFRLGVVDNVRVEEGFLSQFPVAHPTVRPFTVVRAQPPIGYLIYYIEYSDLPLLLSDFTKNTTSAKMFQPVSRALYFGSFPSGDPTAVSLYEFSLLRRKFVTPPHCVRWDFSDRRWTTNGCDSGPMNITHINCSCMVDSLIAVVTESSSLVNVFRLGLSVYLFNTVVLVLAVVLNLFSLILLLATRSSSDTIFIYENLIFAAFGGDLIFILAADVSWGLLFCKLLAVALHYLFLSRMFWCLTLGIDIYRTVEDARNVSSRRIRLYFVLGYALPAICVAISVGLRPDGYGSEHFCWMVLDDHLILSLAIPSMGIILITVSLLALSQCLMVAKKKPNVSPSSEKALRRNLYSSAALCLIFVSVLVVAILAVSLYIPALGYIYPSVVFAQSIFMFLFLCLGTPEVAVLMEEKLVWFIRKKLDLLTSKGANNNKMNATVCETYRNPGISISDSTTYQRNLRPDKDISCSFGKSSSNSTINRSHHTLMQSDSVADHPGTRYSDFHKESESTNDDTASVHSSSVPRDKSATGDMDCASDSDTEQTAFRNPSGIPVIYRPSGTVATFGAPLPAVWNTSPQSIRIATKSPSYFANPISEVSSGKQPSTFATFRPTSKASQHAGHIIDTVTGKLLTGENDSDEVQSNISDTSRIPPPEPFRNTPPIGLWPKRTNLPDIINCEGGTAV